MNWVLLSGTVTDVDRDIGFTIDDRYLVGIVDYPNTVQRRVGEHVIVAGELRVTDSGMPWIRARHVA